MDSVKNGHQSAVGRIDEYLAALSTHVGKYEISDYEGEIDEAVAESLEAFIPARDEYIRLLTAVARYNPDGRWIVRVHRFFERLLPYISPRTNEKKGSGYDQDNFKFFIHELFLYSIAVLLLFERFEQAGHLLSERYYTAQGAIHGAMEKFDDFHKHLGSLEHRNERLKLGSEALRADLLKKRCVGTEVSFNSLMQADFTIFLRAELEYYPHYSHWWPELLMFLGMEGGSFEVYIRARSKAHFDRMRTVLGITESEDLKDLIEAYKNESRRMPRGMKPRSMAQLVAYESLSTTETT